MPRGADKPDETQALADMDELRNKIAQLEERVRVLDQLAHHDPLLGVPNRRGFLRELEWLIDRVSRYGEGAAMLFVDIDGLKQINDRFGHKAGDEALVHVAEALSRGVRKSDCVARLGGDEFGILLAHASAEVAGDTAARLTRQIEENESICDGHRVALGVAVGCTMIAADDTPDSVIARADQSMYRKKAVA